MVVSYIRSIGGRPLAPFHRSIYYCIQSCNYKTFDDDCNSYITSSFIRNNAVSNYVTYKLNVLIKKCTKFLYCNYPWLPLYNISFIRNNAVSYQVMYKLCSYKKIVHSSKCWRKWLFIIEILSKILIYFAKDLFCQSII